MGKIQWTVDGIHGRLYMFSSLRLQPDSRRLEKALMSDDASGIQFFICQMRCHPGEPHCTPPDDLPIWHVLRKESDERYIAYQSKIEVSMNGLCVFHLSCLWIDAVSAFVLSHSISLKEVMIVGYTIFLDFCTDFGVSSDFRPLLRVVMERSGGSS